ncbi:beta-lactamase family protein [Planktomarina sp.]|jgi:CubicO group peptidase (beta-lactamase class C family)|nr:beta-lactamase family protein [Planktomarina sp.]
MGKYQIISNPDLTVGKNNKQRWNQADHRRHGFHNAHRLFRRALMVRSRDVLVLGSHPNISIQNHPKLKKLMHNPAFSAVCVIRDDKVLMEAAAADFSISQPHSIQSISKLHIHLIIGQLISQGVLSLDSKIKDYLPDIGTGYAEASLQSLLDMTVTNDFSEDYSDPHSDCYTEEIALGWRLPSNNMVKESTLVDFTNSITGYFDQENVTVAQYKSANTDVLTRILAKHSPKSLAEHIEEIADAIGYEGAFHISLSPDGYPAFSGGGCLSVRDLARFGLMFAREGLDIHGAEFANSVFMSKSLSRNAPSLSQPKEWLRYSNHLMTDGRFVGHAGYGGQFLLVDTVTKTSCSFFSVLENDDGYDDTYMGEVATTLRDICVQ